MLSPDMAKQPLIALQRMRTDTGSVVLPGCPIPGSQKWSKEVVDRRIRQGFAKKQEPVKPSTKAKAKATTKTAVKTSEKDK